MKVVALSVGNSRIAAALVDGGRILAKRRVPAASKEGWSDFIAWLAHEAREGLLAAVSVNPPLLDTFEHACPLRVNLLGRDMPIPIPDRTLRPEQTGHDRLLDSYAAARLHGAPVLVVDFGTAYTFNLVDEKGGFLGGAITPGLALAAKSLATGCSRLPFLDLDWKSVPLMGLDTESAIRSGLVNGYLGLVDSMILKFLDQSVGSCKTVATGGDAPFFVEELDLIEVHDPDLLLKGIALAFEAAHVD